MKTEIDTRTEWKGVGKLYVWHKSQRPHHAKVSPRGPSGQAVCILRHLLYTHIQECLQSTLIHSSCVMDRTLKSNYWRTPNVTMAFYNTDDIPPRRRSDWTAFLDPISSGHATTAFQSDESTFPRGFTFTTAFLYVHLTIKAEALSPLHSGKLHADFRGPILQR